jgi:hypothetical protein
MGHSNSSNCIWVAMKLKDHRLKPGGVLKDSGAVVGSYEIEEPPAKAMWCPKGFGGGC